MEGSVTFKDDKIKDWKRIRQSAMDRFDKLIISINGGALILSIGFIKDFVDIDSYNSESIERLLLFTWLFFIISIVVNLISQLNTISSMNNMINKNLDNGKGIISLLVF